jgi:hypothetical protein
MINCPPPSPLGSYDPRDSNERLYQQFPELRELFEPEMVPGTPFPKPYTGPIRNMNGQELTFHQVQAIRSFFAIGAWSITRENEQFQELGQPPIIIPSPYITFEHHNHFYEPWSIKLTIKY